jgi:uncharacterized protein (TIGR03066 family)
LLGAWQLTKVEEQDKAPDWRIELLKDGKLRMSSKREGQEYKVEGKWSLKKGKLRLVAEENGKAADTHPFALQRVTNQELVLVDLKVNRKMEFKRVSR